LFLGGVVGIVRLKMGGEMKELELELVVYWWEEIRMGE
jgi:hypothetical protein